MGYTRVCSWCIPWECLVSRDLRSSFYSNIRNLLYFVGGFDDRFVSLTRALHDVLRERSQDPFITAAPFRAGRRRVIAKDLTLRSGAKRGAAAERLPEEEPGRGRHAQTPSELPPRGWRDILLRVWANIGRHRVLAIAAGITFYGLLAIFPGIAAAVALYGFFADPHSAQVLFDQLSGVLPGGAQDVLRGQITRITAQPSSQLGFAFIVGLVTSLWTASSGVRALIDALILCTARRKNVAWSGYICSA